MESSFDNFIVFGDLVAFVIMICFVILTIVSCYAVYFEINQRKYKKYNEQLENENYHLKNKILTSDKIIADLNKRIEDLIDDSYGD